MTPEILWAILGVISAVVLPLLWIRARINSEGSGSSPYEIDTDEDFPDEMQDLLDREHFNQLEQERLRQLENDVREIIENGDQSIKDMLSSAWGKSLPVFSEDSYDDTIVRKIAREVDETAIRILAVASRATVQFDLINLSTTVERTRVPYLADEVELSRLEPGVDLSLVTPDELALPDPIFEAQLAGDELHAFNNIERTRNMPRGYLLVDLSDSMEAVMANGTTRVQWAAGIALRLMFRAVEGNAQFVLRYFGNEPFDMYVVTNKLEAEGVARQLLGLTDRNCGTDIMAALEQAYRDTTEPSDFDDLGASDVILITDGDAQLDEARLKKMFGEDTVRLHAALIGLENPVLKRVAVSYTVY